MVGRGCLRRPRPPYLAACVTGRVDGFPVHAFNRPVQAGTSIQTWFERVESLSQGDSMTSRPPYRLETITSCLNSQFFHAASTAFGYSGLPRLPL